MDSKVQGLEQYVSDQDNTTPPEGFVRFGEYLKANRLANDISARELAARIGVARDTIYRWEAGEMPSAHNLWRWSRALGIDFGNFLIAAFGPPDRVPPTLTGQWLHLCVKIEQHANSFDRWRWGEAMPDGKLGLVLAAVRSLQASARVLQAVLASADVEEVPVFDGGKSEEGIGMVVPPPAPLMSSQDQGS